MDGGGGGGGGGGGDAFSSSTAPHAWHDFLERMRQPSASSFVKSIKSFIVSFSNKPPDPEKDSASVQEFLSKMEAAFRAHTLWAGSSEEQLESAGEGLEKYVMTKLCNHVFASVPEEVNSDIELHEKMALLQQFIRPENLDIKSPFQNESSWLLAQKELLKIDSYKAPRDKLVCILNCCKIINNLLLNASIASHDNPPGADEFLPVIIYVTIKANPPRLHSNLLYIQRYRCHSRLVSEAAYFFTNILSAESFIWNIDAQALSMDELDFQNKMEAARAQIKGIHHQQTITEPAGEQRTGMVKDNKEVDGPHAARAQIKGTHHHQTDTEPAAEQRTGMVKDNKEVDEPHAASQSYDINRDVEEKDKPLTSRSLISDLEKKGAADLLNDENTSRYFQEYPFLFANAGDLTIDDVESLLNCYKKLVLEYVALSKGMGRESLYPPTIPVAASEYAMQTETKNDNSSEVLCKMPSSSEDSFSHVGGMESSAHTEKGETESEKIADDSATESSAQAEA